jgi:hypothetical protein
MAARLGMPPRRGTYKSRTTMLFGHEDGRGSKTFIHDNFHAMLKGRLNDRNA